MDGQLKRGILPFCILKILESEDTYGYDIVKKHKNISLILMRALSTLFFAEYVKINMQALI